MVVWACLWLVDVCFSSLVNWLVCFAQKVTDRLTVN